MDFGIAGKTALVCGSSAGLGFACATALAAEGVGVVMVARNARNLEAAAARLRAEAGGGDAVVVAADVASAAGRALVIKACPRPDILVTNAGGPARKDFRALTLADWQEAMDANFLATVEMIRMVVEGMMTRGWGRIVNITSMTARMPVAEMDRSTAARLAVVGYVAGVARQVAPRGVTINNLLPGTFATERLRQTGPTGAGLAERVPVGRTGDPAEFGAACAFLCSRQAAYITGQNLLIDGGLTNITI